MQDIGYFSISRKLKCSYLHPANENRKFTKYEAWIWLIENANFFCKKKFVSNKLIIIPRGYLITTVTQLSEVWRWNRRTVEKFLQLLEEDCKVKRYKINPKSDKSCTVIKVNNYNSYQPNIYDLCTAEYKAKCKANCTAKCTPNNNDNKDNNKEKNIAKFQKPTIEEIKKYCSERKNKVNPEQFFDFYQSKGWLVGKTPMKDWKAAVRTWEQKDKKQGDNYDPTDKYDGYRLPG